MNGTALSTTTAGSMSVAVLAPTIGWLVGGMPQPVPEPVTLGLAALVIPVIHLVYQTLARKVGAPIDAAPPAPVSPAA